MSELGSVIPRRRLGIQLKELREAHGRTLDEVATELLISTSKLSRLENAQGLPQKRDIRDLARYYRVGTADAEQMMRWADESRRRQWWQKFDVGRDTDGDYMDYEAAASEIHGYAARLVPSMLQTAEYARALIVATDPEAVEGHVIEERVTIRMNRQEIWKRAKDAAMIDLVVDESAFYRKVGDAAVMRTQLQHVADVATKEPQINVRLLEFAAGPHWAAQVGTFTVFKFPDGLPRDVAKADAADKYSDDPKTTGQFLDRFDALSHIALSPEESIERILKIAERQFPR